jgi:hypothetical protein
VSVDLGAPDQRPRAFLHAGKPPLREEVVDPLPRAAEQARRLGHGDELGRPGRSSDRGSDGGGDSGDRIVAEFERNAHTVQLNVDADHSVDFLSETRVWQVARLLAEATGAGTPEAEGNPVLKRGNRQPERRALSTEQLAMLVAEGRERRRLRAIRAVPEAAGADG